jgi:hypothetical protein
MNKQMLNVTLERIIKVVNFGFPGIYEANISPTDKSSVVIRHPNKRGVSIVVKVLGDVVPVTVVTDHVEVDGHDIDVLSNFLDERVSWLKENREYLYSDSEYKFGQLVIESCITQTSSDTKFGTVTVTAILNLRDPDYEDAEDFIKTILAGFHLVQHPNDFDSYLALSRHMVSSNWGKGNG